MSDSSTATSVPNVIIIGLGIVGLAAAIECREKGLNVTAFDKSDILEPIGMCALMIENYHFAQNDDSKLLPGDGTLMIIFNSRGLYWYSDKCVLYHPTMGQWECSQGPPALGCDGQTYQYS